MPRKIFNNTQLDLVVDVIIFLMFLFSTDPRATGVPIHEWLGTAFGAAIIVHLLLHWKWIVNAFKRYLVQPLSRLGQQPQPAIGAITVNDQEGR